MEEVLRYVILYTVSRYGYGRGVDREGERGGGRGIKGLIRGTGVGEGCSGKVADREG